MNPTSARLNVSGAPESEVKLEDFVPPKKYAAAKTVPPGINLDAGADVSVGPGESTDGYELGLVQIQTREVNKAHYRGLAEADGSVFFDAGAQRAQGPCTDAEAPGQMWTSYKGRRAVAPAKPGAVAVPTFTDAPAAGWPTFKTNELTRKPNYLNDMTILMSFITALMFKHPDGTLDYLRSIHWAIGWESSFRTATDGTTALARHEGHGMWFYDSAAPKELPTRYAPAAATCLDVTAAAKEKGPTETAIDWSAGS